MGDSWGEEDTKIYASLRPRPVLPASHTGTTGHASNGQRNTRRSAQLGDSRYHRPGGRYHRPPATSAEQQRRAIPGTTGLQQLQQTCSCENYRNSYLRTPILMILDILESLLRGLHNPHEHLTQGTMDQSNIPL